MGRWEMGRVGEGEVGEGRWGDGEKEGGDGNMGRWGWGLPQKAASGRWQRALGGSGAKVCMPGQYLGGGSEQPQDGAGVCGGEERDHREREPLICFLAGPGCFLPSLYRDLSMPTSTQQSFHTPLCWGFVPPFYLFWDKPTLMQTLCHFLPHLPSSPFPITLRNDCFFSAWLTGAYKMGAEHSPSPGECHGCLLTSTENCHSLMPAHVPPTGSLG